MKKIIFRGVIVIIALSIGGKLLMDKEKKTMKNCVPPKPIWQIICIIIMRFQQWMKSEKRKSSKNLIKVKET